MDIIDSAKFKAFKEIFGSQFVLYGIDVRIIDNSVSNTSFTDGEVVYLHKDQIQTVSEATYTYAHEVIHILLDHVGRMKRYLGDKTKQFYDHTLFNLAADTVIDCILSKYVDVSEYATMHEKIRKFLSKEALKDCDLCQLSMEEIYELLKKEIKSVEFEYPDSGQDGSNSSQSGQNSSSSSSQDTDQDSQPDNKQSQSGKPSKKGKGTTPIGATITFKSGEKLKFKFDVKPTGKPIPKSKKNQWELISKEWEKFTHGKFKGDMPGSLMKEFDIVNRKILDLKYHLAKFLSHIKHGYEDLTFLAKTPSRVNLAYPGYPIRLPKWVSRKARVLISVDTSGSISDKEYVEFLTILNQNLKYVICDFIQCDADISDVILNIDTDKLPKKLLFRKGYGGTSVIPILEWMKKNRKRYDVWIHFTDLYIDDPAELKKYKPHSKHVLWIAKYKTANTNFKPPYGKVLFF